MDFTLFTTPQETVQFISIFSYLNSLSDYLFLQNYLSIDDQRKQIPVVNALYKYLEDNDGQQAMILKLVRHLLKGSDLYGEEEDENVDVVFVNTMFEHIITSLVFDKFGNIYGFLAEVVRKAKTFQLHSLFNDMKTKLRNTTFDNEYGQGSTLTSLAVNRIFADIISPLFPQTSADLSLLSFDYIYAQAGLIFLRPGRVNTVYYNDYQNSTNYLWSDEDDMFDEYLLTGFIIENYLLGNEISSLQVFALPALLHYVSAEFDPNEDIKNLIFDPSHWKAAFKSLFSYLRVTFNVVKAELANDAHYQMHTSFLAFQSRSAITDHFLNHHCEDKHLKGFNLTLPQASQCNRKDIVPFVNELFIHFVKSISELYKEYDLKSINQALGSSFLKSLENTNVSINLLAPNDNIVNGIFFQVTRLPYDLLEFYYPENHTAVYYAFLRENYTITLINDTDDPEGFLQSTNLTLETLISHDIHRLVLKSANQTMNVFWKKFLTYKQLRLESYLQFSDSDKLKGAWWKEFGLSLVPFYPCLTERAQANYCQDYITFYNQLDDITFFDQFDQDISSLITDKETQRLLLSAGTTVERILLKNLINTTMYSLFQANENLQLPLNMDAHLDQVFEKLSLYMKEFGFEKNYVQQETLTFLSVFINKLRDSINYSFMTIDNRIYNMRNCKNNFYRKINTVGKKNKRILYIKYRGSSPHTGYGYKFIYLKENIIGQLRTDYEQLIQIFVLLDYVKPNGDKIYLTVNNDTFEIQHRYIYAINNEIQSSKMAVSLFGISPYSNNEEKCDVYSLQQTHLEQCERIRRLEEKRNHTEECIKYVWKRIPNLRRQQILNILKNYTFPDANRIDLHFIEVWTSTKNLTIPKWSDRYKIENPVLLANLRYKNNLDNRNLTISDGTSRINSIYTSRERETIENGVFIESIINDFNDQKARYVVTFEDYYAVRNFATTGYTRITRDTREAGLMKTALYKLAIRQSDDPVEAFNLTLFSIESKPVDIVDKIIVPGNIHVLRKFTITHAYETFAINSATVAMSGYKNILYEMKFTSPYLRAQIRQFHIYDEKAAILLPGTQFLIVNITETQLFKLGDCLKVTLVYDDRNSKYDWYKSVMKEISRITSENK